MLVEGYLFFTWAFLSVPAPFLPSFIPNSAVTKHGLNNAPRVFPKNKDQAIIFHLMYGIVLPIHLHHHLTTNTNPSLQLVTSRKTRQTTSKFEKDFSFCIAKVGAGVLRFDTWSPPTHH